MLWKGSHIVARAKEQQVVEVISYRFFSLSSRPSTFLRFFIDPLDLRDEIYLYREGSFSRDRSRVLSSLDMTQARNLEGKGISGRLRGQAMAEGDYPFPPMGAQAEWDEVSGTWQDRRLSASYEGGVGRAMQRIRMEATPGEVGPGAIFEATGTLGTQTEVPADGKVQVEVQSCEVEHW